MNESFATTDDGLHSPPISPAQSSKFGGSGIEEPEVLQSQVSLTANAGASFLLPGFGRDLHELQPPWHGDPHMEIHEALRSMAFKQDYLQQKLEDWSVSVTEQLEQLHFAFEERLPRKKRPTRQQTANRLSTMTQIHEDVTDAPRHATATIASKRSSCGKEPTDSIPEAATATPQVSVEKGHRAATKSMRASLDSKAQVSLDQGRITSKEQEDRGRAIKAWSNVDSLEPPPTSWRHLALTEMANLKVQNYLMQVGSSVLKRGAEAGNESTGVSQYSPYEEDGTRCSMGQGPALTFGENTSVDDVQRGESEWFSHARRVRVLMTATSRKFSSMSLVIRDNLAKPKFRKRLVHNSLFDGLCAMVVIFNSVLIGVDVELETLSRSGPVSDEIGWVDMLSHTCTGWFILELVLRITADGKEFFTSQEERKWNWFDFILVCMSMADVVMEVVRIDSPSQDVDISQAFRVFKMLRILRLFRVFRFFKELALLALMIADSMSSLFWAIVLLAIIMYVFAIVFTQSASAYIRDYDEDMVDRVDDKFGNLARSHYSLILSMLGGISWGEVSTPLMSIGRWTTAFFFLYIAFTMLAVLNIITGVFVDNALETGKMQRDWLVHREQRIKDNYLRELSILFQEMDHDDSGFVSWEEMDTALEDPKVREYFTALGMYQEDMRRLFELLDVDGSGEVSVEEFLDGCTRCKGDAKSIDIQAILLECRRIFRTLQDMSIGTKGARNSTSSLRSTQSDSSQPHGKSMVHTNAMPSPQMMSQWLEFMKFVEKQFKQINGQNVKVQKMVQNLSKNEPKECNQMLL